MNKKQIIAELKNKLDIQVMETNNLNENIIGLEYKLSQKNDVIEELKNKIKNWENETLKTYSVCIVLIKIENEKIVDLEHWHGVVKVRNKNEATGEAINDIQDNREDLEDYYICGVSVGEVEIEK